MIADKSIDHLPVVTPQFVAAPSPSLGLRRVRAGLITDRHLSLLAKIYIRQSTPQHILDHRESRECEYELVRAKPMASGRETRRASSDPANLFQNGNGKFVQLVEIGIIMTSDRKEWSARFDMKT